MKLATLCVLAASAGLAVQGDAATPQDEIFVNQAAVGGMAEVLAGQLAQGRASVDPLKTYARKMVEDHTANNQELMTLAAGKGLTPPTNPDAKHQAELAMLQAVPPSAFDTTYVQNQVAGHQTMALVMQQEIKSGTDPDLKAFAEKTLPVVQMHLQMAEQLASGKSP